MKAFIILKESLNQIPILKYGSGVIGIAVIITAIKGFGIEDFRLPVISIMIIFGFMVLLMIFSSILKSRDNRLKFAGYILSYTTLIITCLSSVLLCTSVFFEFPDKLPNILNLLENYSDPGNGSIKNQTEDSIKTVTLTGNIIIDDKVQNQGLVGILQNSEINDSLSYTGSFNMSLSSPENLNNGLITLTITLKGELFELLEINLNDFKDKNNIVDLDTLTFQAIQKVNEKDSPDVKEETKVSKEGNNITVKKRIKPHKINSPERPDPQVLPRIRPVNKQETDVRIERNHDWRSR